MTKDDARKLATEHLAKLRVARSHELVILEEFTREEDFGWVFFYNTKRFVESGDARWCLGGNAPLIVDRRTGEVHATGTGHPIEHYIDEYRRTGRTTT